MLFLILSKINQINTDNQKIIRKWNFLYISFQKLGKAFHNPSKFQFSFLPTATFWIGRDNSTPWQD